jgi:hypothetical protein
MNAINLHYYWQVLKKISGYSYHTTGQLDDIANEKLGEHS